MLPCQPSIIDEPAGTRLETIETEKVNTYLCTVSSLCQTLFCSAVVVVVLSCKRGVKHTTNYYYLSTFFLLLFIYTSRYCLWTDVTNVDRATIHLNFYFPFLLKILSFNKIRAVPLFVILNKSIVTIQLNIHPTKRSYYSTW